MFQSKISYGGKQQYFGTFDKPQDAERVYMLGKEQLQKFCKFEMLAKLEVVVAAKAAAATAKKKKHNVALDRFRDHPCVKGIVKENQKGNQSTLKSR